MREAESGSEETLSTRVTRLIHNIVLLLRARMELTQHEARATVRELVIGGLLGLAALLLVLLAVPVAVLTVILALAELLPVWLASGVVLLAMLVGTAALLLAARRRLRRRSMRLVTGLQEDWRAIREQLAGLR